MKQIYAALQLVDDEVRLLVGEYFSTRFNVIKLERCPCQGISNFRIKDREEVKNAITQLLDKVSKSIGARVEKVILLLPAVGMKRYSLKVQAKTAHGYLDKSDVAKALQEALRSDVDRNYLVINTVLIRYTVNGISLRRLPEKEVCDYFSVDIDLLCIEKELAFEYVSLVESCNIGVMDVFLDSYASAKEAALFEQTMNQNVILLDIGKKSTVFSLLAKGKLISCEYLPEGLSKMSEALIQHYNIPENIAYRLLKFNTTASEVTEKRVVYASGNGKEETVVRTKDICDVCGPLIHDFVEKICGTCQPIFESGATNITLINEGAEMEALREALEKRSKAHVRTYAPETIGVRDVELTALYGAFFLYRELAEIRKDMESSIDLLELENVVMHRSFDADAESLTTRIRNLFAASRENREE